MSPPVGHESRRISLMQAVRTSSLRGIRYGALIGGVVGVVMVLGAFIGGIWSAWGPGATLRELSVAEVAKLLGYIIAGALVAAAYGAGIGAVLMGVLAAARHGWRRIVRRRDATPAGPAATDLT